MSLESLPILSFKALQKGRSTLEDFAKTYMIYHDCTMANFFEFMDVLIYVECLIYAIDEMNEEIAQKESNNQIKETFGAINEQQFQQCIQKNKMLAHLIQFLESKNLYDDKIKQFGC